MDKWEEIRVFMVLKYVKKNEPTQDEFQRYVDDISYGFEYENEEHEDVYRTRGMITAGNDSNLVLTKFGETILKNIQSKKYKEIIQIFVPVGALITTTVTLTYSIVIGF